MMLIKNSLAIVSIIVIILFSCIPITTSETEFEPGFVPLESFKRVIFYYGWVNTSNLLDIDFDILVFSGADIILTNQYDVIDALRTRSVEVYAYLHEGNTPVGLGSSFKSMVVDGGQSLSDWVAYIEGIIDRYIGLVDGVFLDECDPRYFGTTNPDDPLLQEFNQGLQQIVDYAKNKGLKVFVNGVRAYASLGDYYLWENFVAIYDRDTGTYTIDQNFFTTTSNNPYEWVNGIAKYNYLKENNLLSKTIALSYADITCLDNAKYGYYMARILGLGGWAFAPGDVYANGGNVLELDIYETGPAITDPVIDTQNNFVSRVFTSGEIMIDYSTTPPTLILPSTFKPVRLDAQALEYDNLDTTTLTGTATSIEALAYLITPKGLYLYVKASYSGLTDVILHIYIDYDGDSTTGYGGKGNYGADYMVEVHNESNEALLWEYTGTGGWDWSWNLIDSVKMVNITNGNTLSFEFIIPLQYITSNVSYLSVATVYNYEDDALKTGILLSSVFSYNIPTLFDDRTLFQNQYAEIQSIEVTKQYTRIVAYAPSGVLAKYTICVPYDRIEKVMKNGSELTKYDTPSFTGEGYYVEYYTNYANITIRVIHSSPVTITIYPPSAGKGTSGLGGIAYDFSSHTLITAIIVSMASLSILLIMYVITTLKRCVANR
ncbi:hypothetical protein J4526_06300 [Desulfurococcaceae archaeon MEX13E-LK6-19]|nr:hypothetical protein J4526_06300 [Desulfurococcaceae archaeon MEX13E-LK6-19]